MVTKVLSHFSIAESTEISNNLQTNSKLSMKERTIVSSSELAELATFVYSSQYLSGIYVLLVNKSAEKQGTSY